MASMCSFVGLAAGFLLLAPLLRSQADAANLVVNGGFEAGTAGFTSGYSYVPPTPQSSCYPEGTYTVGGNPNDCHNLWASFSPHTGSGMMIVNGASTAGVNVWQENGIAVSPDTNYLFSVWIASNYPTSSADLTFSINGSDIGSPFMASTTTGLWQEFSANWNSGSNITAQLDIVNLNTAASGNDFSLDDISLAARAVPEPATLMIMGTAVLGLGWTQRNKLRSQPSLG